MALGFFQKKLICIYLIGLDIKAGWRNFTLKTKAQVWEAGLGLSTPAHDVGKRQVWGWRAGAKPQVSTWSSDNFLRCTGMRTCLAWVLRDIGTACGGSNLLRGGHWLRGWSQILNPRALAPAWAAVQTLGEGRDWEAGRWRYDAQPTITSAVLINKRQSEA